MPAALKFTRQEAAYYFVISILNHFSSQAQNIGIVMSSGTQSTEDITAQGSPYTLYLISGNAHTDAG
jgi:hypothetical protein